MLKTHVLYTCRSVLSKSDMYPLGNFDAVEIVIFTLHYITLRCITFFTGPGFLVFLFFCLYVLTLGNDINCIEQSLHILN